MKNYEEKLKLAKEALESGSYDKETIEYIFPELKESKEERIRKWILEKFESYTGPCPFNREDIISWIKSQKSQSKLEESENYDQDEKIRKEIINMVRFYYGLNKAFTQSISEDDLVNWLKSLKPQSHWKPNEKQMEALSITLKSKTIHGFYFLESLYNDLKKLM